MFRPAPTTARVRQSVGGEESLPQQGEEVPSATIPVATALSETVATRERRAGRRGEAGRRDPPLWVHWHNTPSTVAPGASARLVGTPSVSLRVRRPRGGGGAGGAVRARGLDGLPVSSPPSSKASFLPPLAVKCPMGFGPRSLSVVKHRTIAAAEAPVLTVVASVLLFLFLFLFRGHGVSPGATAGAWSPWSVRGVPTGGVPKL